MPLKTPAEVINSISDMPATFLCRVCGGLVTIYDPFISGIAIKLGVTCEKCCEADNRERAASAIESRVRSRFNQFKFICPEDFMETDPRRLPLPGKLDQVTRWKFGARGLTLRGPTGTGKSRCMWVLAKRQFMAGKSIRALDHTLHNTYGAIFARGSEAAERWAAAVTTADILLLDDVFKAKLTDSLEAALFSVISCRTERNRPIIATLNDTGSSLASRLTEDRGAAMVRRLREFSEAIEFTK